MPVIAPSDTESPAMRGNVLSANFQRRMAGLDDMGEEERTRFDQRQQLDTQRQAMLEQLAANMGEQEERASEIENTLRASGLSDVAERFRRTSRRQAFNAARRGLAGGSADIEQQVEARGAAEQEARQVGEQARLQTIQQLLKAQQQRDKLAQEVVRQDPFQAQREQLATGGIQQATQAAQAQAEAQRLADQARTQGQLAQLGIISGLVGGYGENIGGFVADRERARGGISQATVQPGGLGPYYPPAQPPAYPTFDQYMAGLRG